MRDWVFEHGETYGYASSPIDRSEHLCVGIYDDNTKYSIQNFIQLVIANPALAEYIPVGGELAPVSREDVLWRLIQRIAVYLIAFICCVIAIRKLL